MRQMKKVGIMGGTFNPIHTAHLILAEQAFEQFNLDTVLFMPSKNPPHKDNRSILSDSIRKEMVLLAIDNNPHFELSTVELDREGITYTADTMEYLSEINPDWEIYFILGADSLYHIDSWKSPEVIFAHSKILAATRYAIPDDHIKARIDELNQRYLSSIYLLKTPNLELSSEFIRNSVSENHSIKYYVPEEVENYILEHGLYKDIM
jgi:nicotinate-nucleotide adenylyltransferase